MPETDVSKESRIEMTLNTAPAMFNTAMYTLF